MASSWGKPLFSTRITDLFEIEFPIILGGMVFVGGAPLAAAVSEAGGLGLLGAGSMSPDDLKNAIEEVLQKTGKPFGVNIPLVRPDSGELIELSLDRGAAVIATSSGSPRAFTQRIHDAGGKVLHVVSNVKFAEKSEAAGVDAVAAEGFEAGGHNGFDEITTMALIPQVTRAVKIPVVAAGGIADGRGMAAALALGAEGVQLGTRFIATIEAGAHDNYKKAVVRMGDQGTCITGRTTVGPTRAVRNPLTDRIAAAECGGMSAEKLFEMIGGGRSALAAIEGNCEEGTMYCGQIGGLVTEILPAGEVVREMVREAREAVLRLSDFALPKTN